MRPGSAPPSSGPQVASSTLHRPPAFVLSKLGQFSSASGLEHFLLIGGAAIDPLLSDSPEVADWDIVIEDDTFNATAIVHALEQASFTVGSPRDYQMNLDKTAVCFPARHPTIGTFDVAIVEDLEFFGPFDVESLSVAYPAGLVIDDHDAIGAIKAKRASLIRPMERESPAMLAKRLFVLAGKYGIRFGPSSATARTAESIREGLMSDRTPPPSLPAQAACLEKFLRALQRADRPRDLLDDALDSRLLLGAVPPLDAVVRSPSFARAIDRSDRLGSADLLATIREIDRDGTCAGVAAALGERVWDHV